MEQFLVILVGLGAVVGSLIRILPNEWMGGLLHNRLIPRWVQVCTFAYALIDGLRRFNDAAGLGMAPHAGIMAAGWGGVPWGGVLVAVKAAGFSWLATWLAKKGYDEANGEAQRPAKLLPQPLKPAAPRVPR